MVNHPGKIALLFLALGCILYFGFEIVSNDIKTKSSPISNKNKETTEIEFSDLKAENELEANQKAELEQYKLELKNSTEESKKIEILKKLSGFWYQRNNAMLSGNYAVKVASLENTAESWGIAGTTYLSGIDASTEVKIKQDFKDKAIAALDKAIALNPNEPQHKMNKALCSIKLPDENPMEGILQLLQLDKEVPEFLPVQILLSQLAMKTGQWDKAYTRLQRVIKLNPKNKESNCLMIDLIQQSGKKENTTEFEKICNQK